MWLLAIKAMLGDRTKLLIALLGVSFSVVLVNLQGGLLLGLIHKSSLLVDRGGADIWVGPRHMSNVDMGGFVRERWLQPIRGTSGVERADAYLLVDCRLKMPDGRIENAVVVGCEPASLLGSARLPMAAGRIADVRQPDAVLVDESDAEKLGNCQIGDIREINGRRARVVGLTRGAVGFTPRPYVFTTLERARSQYAAGMPAEQCSYFLVKAKPGTDVTALCNQLRDRLPGLDVYDSRGYSLRCMRYWLTNTGIGISFGLAAFLGLLVGLAVVAQTLYAGVMERLKEYGTLKALGADNRCVARFLLTQALGSAVVGSALGLVAALVIGVAVTSAQAPVRPTFGVAVLSVVLVTAVCLLAAWLPCRRVCRIDPAGVLRG